MVHSPVTCGGPTAANLRRTMTATQDTAAADGGLSRRSVPSRGATGLGLALTGSLNGLFGTTASAHGPARAAGYGR